MKNIIFAGLLILIVFSSCKKDLPDVGGTSAQSMANEWWVTFTLNGQDVYSLGHKKIATYNTASNDNTMWVDDLNNLWQFKVKANADFKNLTFSASQAQNQDYNIKVDIMNGKVLVGKAHSKTGNVTDSIYMQARFSDDSTNVYTISGSARTQWPEDDY